MGGEQRRFGKPDHLDEKRIRKFEAEAEKVRTMTAQLPKFDRDANLTHGQLQSIVDSWNTAIKVYLELGSEPPAPLKAQPGAPRDEQRYSNTKVQQQRYSNSRVQQQQPVQESA